VVSTPWRQTAGYISDFEILKFFFSDFFIKGKFVQTYRGLTFGADRFFFHSGQHALASDRGLCLHSGQHALASDRWQIFLIFEILKFFFSDFFIKGKFVQTYRGLTFGADRYFL